MLCGWGGNRRRKVMAAYRRWMTTVTCGLTACTSGSAPGPTLGIEYGKAFTFYLSVIVKALGCGTC